MCHTQRIKRLMLIICSQTQRNSQVRGTESAHIDFRRLQVLETYIIIVVVVSVAAAVLLVVLVIICTQCFLLCAQ